MIWAIELGEYDLTYQPRTAIKGQALADFVTEFTWEEAEVENNLETTEASNNNVFRDSEEVVFKRSRNRIAKNEEARYLFKQEIMS